MLGTILIQLKLLNAQINDFPTVLPRFSPLLVPRKISGRKNPLERGKFAQQKHMLALSLDLFLFLKARARIVVSASSTFVLALVVRSHYPIASLIESNPH
jgi:hypothetical protein